MRKITTALLTGSALLLFTACGSGGGSSGGGGTPSINYNGNYNVVVTPSVSEASGYDCVGASGLMNISNSVVTGKVTTKWGNVYDLSGNVSSNGYISGGFAVVDFNAATYEGQLNGNGGSGSWEDIYGCYGNWTSVRR